MSDVKVICDVCDEFVIIGHNETTSKAYTRHSLSAYHVEIERRFRSILLGQGDASLSNESVTSFNYSASLPKSYCLFNCHLCQIDINNTSEMLQHLKSVKHCKLESYIKEVNVKRDLLKLLGFSHKQNVESNEILNFFSDSNSMAERFCLICDKNVVSKKYDDLLDHVSDDKNHIIKFNSLFLNFGRNHTFYCLICNVVNKGNHCDGIQHRNNILSIFKFSRYGSF